MISGLRVFQKYTHWVNCCLVCVCVCVHARTSRWWKTATTVIKMVHPALLTSMLNSSKNYCYPIHFLSSYCATWTHCCQNLRLLCRDEWPGNSEQYIGNDVAMAEFEVVSQNLPDATLETHWKHVRSDDFPAEIQTNLYWIKATCTTAIVRLTSVAI
jgi:hypothetical protein